MHCFERRHIGQLAGEEHFFWLDLVAPSETDIEKVRAELALPEPPEQPVHGRPRLFEERGDTVVLVCRSAVLDDEDEVRDLEVHVYISGTFVVTVHDEEVESFQRLRARLERDEDQEEEWTVSRVLDAIYDPLVEVLEDVDDHIAGLEAAIIEHPHPSQLEQIATSRRDLLALRRRIVPQRDLLERVGVVIAGLPGLDSGDRIDVLDVAAYLGRVAERIDNYSLLLTGALDIYLSTTANKLNEVMWRLTVVATVFLPLTFVTGFFGQNFAWLNDHVQGPISFIVLGLLMCGLSAGLTYLWLMWIQRRQLVTASGSGGPPAPRR